MILSHFSLEQCGWLNGASADPIVLSSRVRLARNVADYAFSNWADTGAMRRTRELLCDAFKEVFADNDDLPVFEFLQVDELSELDREFLYERNLISREMVESNLPRAVAISEDETISIMINEEDHLRMQCLRPGRDLTNAWQLIDRIDDELSRRVDYAFSPRWGYLTACPTNTGTGVRGGVMMHLPSLVLARQVESVLKAVQRNGLAIRGLGGEGADITGNIFQVSNQVTLGISERQALDSVLEVMVKILEAEDNAGKQLLEQARTQVEDNVWRAYGVLANARSITSDEARRLISSVRLGITSGIVDCVSFETANEILLCSGPAHLRKLIGEDLDDEDRDRRRADFIRERLSMN